MIASSIAIDCIIKKLFDVDGMATLYKTKVRSLMEYCGPVWQGAAETGLKKLDVIQSKACKFLGTKVDVCLKFNLDSLDHCHTVSGLCQIYQMVSHVALCKGCELLHPYDAKNKYSWLTENGHYFQLTTNASRTTIHMHSFIPCYTRRWNNNNNNKILN